MTDQPQMYAAVLDSMTVAVRDEIDALGLSGVVPARTCRALAQAALGGAVALTGDLWSDRYGHVWSHQPDGSLIDLGARTPATAASLTALNQWRGPLTPWSAPCDSSPASNARTSATASGTPATA